MCVLLREILFLIDLVDDRRGLIKLVGNKIMVDWIFGVIGMMFMMVIY